MKSKTMILSCLAVAAVLLLPSVCAGSMRLNAWTDKRAYTIGETVTTYVVWVVQNPPDFDHDKCNVTMEYQRLGTSEAWFYWGEYVVGQGGDGPIELSCVSALGDAQHEWDTTGKSADTYWIVVTATAWDYSQQDPEDQEIHDYYITATFTLSDP